MVSNIHKTVVKELENGKSNHQVLKDLMISFIAVTLKTMKSSEDSLIEKAVRNYSLKLITFASFAIQNPDISIKDFEVQND